MIASYEWCAGPIAGDGNNDAATSCHRLAAAVASRRQGVRDIVMVPEPVLGLQEVTMSDDRSDGPVERYLAAIEGAAMAGCDALSPDVTLDATVPHWRFGVRGDAAVRAELARWYADAGSFEELKRTPLPTGELVEFTLRWEQEGVPYAVHQAHIVEVTDGRITRDQVWCGGPWSATLLAEMAEAADVTA
jgi:ketosteroid isomerase-like protein